MDDVFDPGPGPVPMRFDIDYAKDVLAGVINRLSETFTFAATNQGWDFWYNIAVSRILTPEGRHILEAWIALAEKPVEPEPTHDDCVKGVMAIHALKERVFSRDRFAEHGDTLGLGQVEPIKSKPVFPSRALQQHAKGGLPLWSDCP